MSAKGPSREDRRKYANSGKAAYYYNLENVLFPQAVQGIGTQALQIRQALDQNQFTNEQNRSAYVDTADSMLAQFDERVDAYMRSDDAYRANAGFIQSAFDEKADQANAAFAEIAQGIAYDKNAAERQFKLQKERAQLNTNAIDLQIRQLYNAQSDTNAQILSAGDRRDTDITTLENRSAEDIARINARFSRDTGNVNSRFSADLSDVNSAAQRNRTFLDAQLANQTGTNDLSRRSALANNATELAKLSSQQNLINNQISQLQSEKAIREERIDFQYNTTVRQSMDNMLDNQLKSIQAQGSALARGQRGNSAQRAVSTIKAMNGINQARLTDGINRAGESRATDIKESNLADTQKRQQLNTSLAINQADIDRSNLREGEINDEWTLRSALINSEYSKNVGDTNAEAARSRRKLAETREDSLNQLSETAGDTKRNINRRLQDDSRSIRRNAEDNLRTLRSQSRDRELEVAQQENQIKLIAAQLGFDKEQLSMTKKQLGQSLRSAKASSRLTFDTLRRQAKQENINGFYAKMARPRFAGLPSAPYQVPPPTFTRIVKPAGPPPFLNASKSGYLDATAQQGQSGLSKALQIGGSVLSLAAIPFTAGASATGVFGLTASQAGVASAALGSTGQIFSQSSNIF